MKETVPYQIIPARCKGSVPVDHVLSDPESWDGKWAAEEKKDDIRYLLQICPGNSDHNFLTSRRVSVVTGKLVQKEDKLPHIRDFKFPDWLRDTVFDGGIYGGGFSSDVQHEIATGSQCMYAVWDVLKISGKSVAELPYQERRQLILSLRKFLPDWMTIIPNSDRPSKLLKEVLDSGGEGIVLKDPDAPYGEGWLKVKREETYDVVIWDYEWSTSQKYGSRNWIKSVKFGQWVPEDKVIQFGLEHRKVCSRKINGVPHVLIDCGRASGMTEDVRKTISEDPEKYAYTTIEIEAQQRFPSGKFRHPRFLRFREEKSPYECIWIPTEKSSEEKEEAEGESE